MGYHDEDLAKYLYKPVIANNVDLENIKSIAWLGWANDNKITKTIIYNCPNLQKSDLYDIDINQNDKTKYWDINEDWGVSGYDLVICLRTTLFSKSSEHFLRNLKKTIDNNGKVIVDFLLPEIKRLSDFSILKREEIRNYFNISDCFSRAEGYFSWFKPYFIHPENDDCSTAAAPLDEDQEAFIEALRQSIDERVRPTLYPCRFRPGYQFSQDYECWLKRDGAGDGYHMMPFFPTVYKANFKHNVGYEFDTEKMVFLSPPKRSNNRTTV